MATTSQLIAPDFRDGYRPEPGDVFLAVMGVTGAGKSTFISLCSDRQVKIGHNLQACTSCAEIQLTPILTSPGTQDVGVYRCNYSPTKAVYLVDTPGFDDTNRSDTDVLREIATWLTDSYANRIKLNGIIYLHRITDRRMQGSAKRNLMMFKKLCGKDALKNIVLATTMWEQIDAASGDSREAELVNTPDFWGWMRDQGSQVIRHTNDNASAMKLIDIFASKYSEKAPIVLDLQSDMVDHEKTLNETAAGKVMGGAIAEEREKLRKQLEEAQADMKEALESRDKEAAEMLDQVEKEMNQKVERLDRDRQELEISMEKLHLEKYAKLERALEASRQQSAETMRALKEAKREQDLERQRIADEKQKREMKEEQREAEYKRSVAALEARLDKEEKAREEREKKRLKETEEKLRLLSVKTPVATGSPLVRSHPGINRISEYASLAMWGDRYYWVGPAWASW